MDAYGTEVGSRVMKRLCSIPLAEKGIGGRWWRRLRLRSWPRWG